ncbi:hypothetical protein O181_050523 [Austropuccinia psidii MF-1]|uniref:RNA-binding protein 26 n=1 Tax=Austropuccinia psidii MF-1 TaxID=1389203 RepID=A0A9Q3E1X0_9BASI|nr:hypothetical protein [Austropuccinia psidii MF-1]
MIIEAAKIQKLKEWMIDKLKLICDADHLVLSEYVVALLKHDQSEDELRNSCLNQLDDFLQQETKSFVDDLFDHLHLTGNFNYQSNPTYSSPPTILGKRSKFISQDFSPPSTANSPNDLDHRPTQSLPSTPIPQYTPTQSHPSFLLFTDSSINQHHHQFNNPPSNLVNHPFHSIPNQSHPPRSSKRPRRSGICRDYHYRGYCARGHDCLFSHDERDSTNLSNNNSSASQFYPNTSGHQIDSIDSQSSSIPIIIPSILDQKIPQLANSLEFPNLLADPFYKNHNQSFSNQTGSYPDERNLDRSTRFNPSLKKSQTTLVVENIPPSSLSDRCVREYFSTFGTLSSVSVDVYNAQALVTFNSPEGAKKAYSSPVPVFNNRFVKIHFKRIGNTSTRREPISQQNNREYNEINDSIYQSSFNNHQNVLTSSINSTVAEQSVSSLPLPSDPRTLSQREQELRVKIEAQKRLLQELGQKKAQQSGPTAQGGQNNGEFNDAIDRTEKINPNDDTEIRDINHQPDNIVQKDTDKASYGIEQVFSSPVYSSRGGRNLSNLPRNSFGNSRASWNSNHAPTKAFKLDNRSCTLAIRQIPSSTDQNLIKNYLEQFGTIVSITSLESEDADTPGDLSVKFSTRSEAEKVLANGMEIPKVGKVLMNWIPLKSFNSTILNPHHQTIIPGLKNSNVFSLNNTMINSHSSIHENKDQIVDKDDKGTNGGDVKANDAEDNEFINEFQIEDDDGDGWKR